MNFVGKRVTVMGLGVFGGGVGVARFLLDQGAAVTVTDTDTADHLAESVAAVGPRAAYHLGGHVPDDFTQTDLVVANPAVKPRSEFLCLAHANGVPVTTEMNLFFERCPAPVVGVTGSVGKTTTAAMLHRALHAAAPHGCRVWLGGNIGKSLLLDLPAIRASDLVVLELSSAQLHYLGPTGRAPHVAVVTNISENHIDWHDSFENYIAAKKNIAANQRPRDTVVLNADDEVLSQWAEPGQLPSRIALFSAAHPVARGAFVRDGRILVSRAESEDEVADGARMRLPGAHNRADAAAAAAACGALLAEWYAGPEPFAAALGRAGRALEAFEGAEHRLEFVREIGGVRYYNDSKATTPVSALAALDSFDPASVVLILGGRDKNVSYTVLADRAASCRAAVFVGEMAGPLDALLAARSTTLTRVRAGTIDAAVAASARLARPGDVVLLSPACTSYDQFRNFEERGRAFKVAVARLVGEG